MFQDHSGSGCEVWLRGVCVNYSTLLTKIFALTFIICILASIPFATLCYCNIQILTASILVSTLYFLKILNGSPLAIIKNVQMHYNYI